MSIHTHNQCETFPLQYSLSRVAWPGWVTISLMVRVGRAKFKLCEYTRLCYHVEFHLKTNWCQVERFNRYIKTCSFTHTTNARLSHLIPYQIQSKTQMVLSGEAQLYINTCPFTHATNVRLSHFNNLINVY